MDEKKLDRIEALLRECLQGQAELRRVCEDAHLQASKIMNILKEFNYTKTKKANNKNRRSSSEIEAEVDSLFGPDKPALTLVKPEQPKLFAPRVRESKSGPRTDSALIPDSLRREMYALCYRAETQPEILALDSKQRGRVSMVLGKLLESKAELDRLADFKIWWHNSWMSKSAGTGQYNPPRPEQVKEHWFTAMKARQPARPVLVVPEPTTYQQLCRTRQ
jgi:hypothetical protein